MCIDKGRYWRLVLRSFSAFVISAFSILAYAQGNYPNRPIKLIIPFPVVPPTSMGAYMPSRCRRYWACQWYRKTVAGPPGP